MTGDNTFEAKPRGQVIHETLDRVQASPVRFFIPVNETQARILACQARGRLVFGGNRSDQAQLGRSRCDDRRGSHGHLPD